MSNPSLHPYTMCPNPVGRSVDIAWSYNVLSITTLLAPVLMSPTVSACKGLGESHLPGLDVVHRLTPVVQLARPRSAIEDGLIATGTGHERISGSIARRRYIPIPSSSWNELYQYLTGLNNFPRGKYT